MSKITKLVIGLVFIVGGLMTIAFTVPTASASYPSPVNLLLALVNLSFGLYLCCYGGVLALEGLSNPRR